MKEAEIQETIKNTLRQRFGVPGQLIDQLKPETHLCGSPTNLNSVDLIYLFFEVEKVFGIHISEENLGKNGFRSLEEITAVVKEARAEAV